MSKLPNIPDFIDEPQSMGTSLRAVKQAVEIIGGQRQGPSLGAPQIFVQENEPVTSRVTQLSLGDLWIDPVAKKFYFYAGQFWVALI